MASRPVLLFKDSTVDSNYEKTFENQGYTAKCVPVLHTIHTNIAELVESLSEAKEQQIRGMLITSKRSCESLGEALAQMCSDSGESIAESLAYLSTIPFYVVGEATATAVREIQDRFKDKGFTSVLVRGEHSGTGEQLGKFIVEHHERTGCGILLYLTGDKNRDTVPLILSQNSLPFRSLKVYETRQRPDFQSLLEEAVDSLSPDGTTGPWWVVYFAPSTAKFALPAARKLFSSRNISSRVATIGPVTTTSIEKANGFVVQVTAAKPEPLSLFEAIRIYDDRSGSGS